MPQLEARSTAKTSASPDAVWRIARDFCAPWHPAIAEMRAETGAEGGLVRAFSVHGEDTVYRERLTWFSDSDRTLGYAHVEGIAGVESYAGRLIVSSAENGGAEITMSARMAAPSGRAEEIASGTQAIFDAGVAALAGLATETGDEAAPPAPTPAQAQTVMVGGRPRLAISATPRRDGPLVLFLHGIGGARSNWDAQLSAIGGAYWAAAIDLRGYGDSALGPAQSTVDDYCADILRVKTALGADRLILCGLSYGAWIATSFAMRHPELLDGLILSGGCTGMSEAGAEEREAFRASREVPLAEGRTPADFAPAVVNVLAGPDAGDATRESLRASMAAIPVDTYRDALRCFTNPRETFEFSRLTMPVMMMTGEHDRLAPPHEIRSVAERIHDAAPRPDVRFEVLRGAGHVCNVEAPVRYNRLLLEFLGRVLT